MAAGKLKLYFDLMSQPSRAVYLFLKINEIPFEPKPVALRKGEHQTEEYKKINPFGLVPVIDDNGFILTESVSILSYLSDQRGVADHWYPKDLRARARVDQYMSWQQHNTRLYGSMVFRTRVIEPRAKNTPVNQEQLSRAKAGLQVALDQVESIFLKENPYISGKEISIADLLCICELMQPWAGGFDINEGRPKLAAYVERVRQRLEPHFTEANVVVEAVRDAVLKARI